MQVREALKVAGDAKVGIVPVEHLTKAFVLLPQ